MRAQLLGYLARMVVSRKRQAGNAARAYRRKTGQGSGAAGSFTVSPGAVSAALWSMNGLVRVTTILLRFQVAKLSPEGKSLGSFLQHPDVALVYQTPDQP